MDKVNEKTNQSNKSKSPSDRKATRKEKAILALLQQPTIEKAAEVAGVHPATLYRWRKDPKFQKDLLAARREAYGQAMGRLQQASAAAVSTLLRIMTDGQNAAPSRVQAARCVLDQSGKALEYEDVLIRLAQVETNQAQLLAANPTKEKP